jgi:3-oxoacyl-[acyl-carrier-protein] synthase II
MSDSTRVVITGLGVVSSIGVGKEEFWDGLLKGRSGISPVSAFDTSNQFTHNGGEVKIFRPDDSSPDGRRETASRASHMALTASRLAWKDAGFSGDQSNVRVGTCIGTNIGSIQTVEQINEAIISKSRNARYAELIHQVPTNTTPAIIAREFGLQGPNMMFSTACAAGNYAIGFGFDLIKLQRVHAVVVGGADAFSRVAFTGFNQFSAITPDVCRPFDKNRKGMIVAEGAGILIMESLEGALQRGASVYAEVLGYGLSCDAHHMTTSTVEGIAACMKKALRETGVPAEDVDYISAHGTGTVTNDRNECAAIREVFGDRYRKIPVSSIKSMIGHTMGAASALEAIACALVVSNDMIPPTINFETHDPECDIDCVPTSARKQVVDIALNNSYAFGGNNASLVLKKFTE